MRHALGQRQEFDTRQEIDGHPGRVLWRFECLLLVHCGFSTCKYVGRGNVSTLLRVPCSEPRILFNGLLSVAVGRKSG
jgi:hypothetical protein